MGSNSTVLKVVLFVISGLWIYSKPFTYVVAFLLTVQYIVFKLVSCENQRILRFDLDLIVNNFEILCIGATKELSSNI